jgi:hypothetical protein
MTTPRQPNWERDLLESVAEEGIRIFHNRNEYKILTGQDAPPYDSTRDLQTWDDPSQANNTKRTVAYPRALVLSDDGKSYVKNADGSPLVDVLLVARADTLVPNFPVGAAGPEGAPLGTPTPFPLRALTPNEELAFDMGGNVVVANKLHSVPTQATSWTEGDRALLKAIYNAVLKP